MTPQSPCALPHAHQAKTAHIEFAIHEDGGFFWNGEQIEVATLPERFAQEAKKQPQPELHIRADRLAHYELVAQVMSGAAKAGITRIGFVTDPTQAP